MRAILLLPFLLISIATVAQSSKLTKAQMEEDYDALLAALKEAHGGLYRFTKQSELDRQLQSYRDKIPDEASVIQFASLVSEATALIRDGHNRLESTDATQSFLTTAKLLPLQFMIEGRKLMVLYNDTQDNQSIAPGMEVTTINGQSSAAIIEQCLPKISGDGFIEIGKVRRLERTFALSYWLYIDQASEFNISAKTGQGKEISVRLVGVVNADRVTNRNTNAVNKTILKNGYIPGTQTRNIRLTFRGDVACLSIRGFEGGPFTAQLDSVFDALRKKGTNKLILDLRGNGGGVDLDGAYLVSSLTDKPFRYFDHIKIKTLDPSFTKFKASTYEDLKAGTVRDIQGGYRVTGRLHGGVEVQQPAPVPFLGKLVVLINGGSFSTTADVCALLRHLKRGTFVGEETAGAAEGNTSGMNAMFKFPNSGLKLRISMYGYWNAVNCVPGRGTMPDVKVKRTVAELLSGKDSQLEKGLEILAK